MRILHFIYDHPDNPWVGGGGAIRVRTLGRLLAGKGHSVQVVCGRFPGCRPDPDEGVDFQFVGVDRGYVLSTFSYAVGARRWLSRTGREADVVVEDFAPWNPVYSYRVRGVPAVVQLQNRIGTEILRRYGPLGIPFYLREKTYPGRFQHAIVNNDSLNQAFEIDGEVIPMGVDASWLKVPPQEGTYLAFLGRIDFRQKGLDLLLDAARRVDIPIEIAGDGPGRNRLRRELPSLPHVEWRGKLHGRDIAAFLAGARAVVAPSRFEGQSMSVLEAAALARPVVVSSIPEHRYAVDSGFALAFPSGSTTELAEMMQRLWDEPKLAATMGARGRQHAATCTWPRVADRFEAFCGRVVHGEDRLA